MLKFTIPSRKEICMIKDKIEVSDWDIMNGLDSNRFFLRDYVLLSPENVSACGNGTIEDVKINDCHVGVLPFLDLDSVDTNNLPTLMYPKTIAPWKVRCELEKYYKEWSNYKSVDSFCKIGMITVVEKSKKETFDFCQMDVFSLGDKFYVRAKCNFKNGFNATLSNGYTYFQNGWEWVTVEKIQWKTLDNKYAFPDTILFAGVPFSTSKEYDGKFYNTFLSRYLDEKFSYEIQQFSDIVKLYDLANEMQDIELDLEETLEECDERINKISAIELEKDNNKKINEIKYAEVLNKKKFVSSPAIGREQELESLMIALAQNKKIPILVGESGVGKTSIVDELVYLIQRGEVPKFLKNQLIVEVNPQNLVAGTSLRGQFEQKVKETIDYCIKNKAIMVINDIHTIYGAGAGALNDANDMAAMIKYAIDRNGLKVIGTITEAKYNQFFANDDLKRRFNKIIVKEPTDNVLYQIIEKVINDYSNESNISAEDILENYPNIIDVIMELTEKKHRSHDDKVNNPDLSVEIIDSAFGYAKYLDSDNLELEHFIKAININNRLYDEAKQKAIKKIEEMKPLEEKGYQKIIKFNQN